jgi:DNA-directed RNA polymerase specialized sigma24 family protein
VANELRKGQRKARVIYMPLSDKLLEVMDDKHIQSDDQEAGRLIKAMTECLKRLPRLSRELLYHRYADQKNATQLSEQHHVSPVAMRLKLMRIRAAVKGCVEGKLV